jgi:hypothetical protein
MGYAAIALAIMGLVTGIMFRTKLLLLIVALLVPVSVGVAADHGFGLLGVALTIMIAQTIFQASYFLGLVVADSFHRLVGRHSSVKTPPSPALEQALAREKQVMAFDTQSKTPHLPRLFARGIAQDRSPCRQR